MLRTSEGRRRAGYKSLRQTGWTCQGNRLTGKENEQNVNASAMVLKLHSCRGLCQQGVPHTTVTVNTLATYRRGERFRQEITATAAGDADAGEESQAFTDGRVPARVEPPASRVRPPREASATTEGVSKVRTDSSTRPLHLPRSPLPITVPVIP